MERSVIGVILAGGRGERLGTVEKSALQFGGGSLLMRVWAQVSAQATSWALASDGYRPSPCPDDLTILADPFNDKRGPLAGVLAAYCWHNAADYVLSVPVDTPFFPKDFASRAQGLLNSAPSGTIVMGQYGADHYPTAALWPMATLKGLADWLDSADNLSIRGYMGQFNVVRLDYEPISPTANPFANINRAEDIAQLEKML